MSDPVKFLIAQAMTGYESLSIPERITLLRGVMRVIPQGTEENESAQHMIWLLERSEAEQLKFRSLLTTSK